MARGGIRGSFLHVRLILKYHYRRTAAFYRLKISRCVKMLLSLEGWPTDNFPIEYIEGILSKFGYFGPYFSVF